MKSAVGGVYYQICSPVGLSPCIGRHFLLICEYPKGGSGVPTPRDISWGKMLVTRQDTVPAARVGTPHDIAPVGHLHAVPDTSVRKGVRATSWGNHAGARGGAARLHPLLYAYRMGNIEPCAYESVYV